jgi:arsenite methyltransferase
MTEPKIRDAVKEKYGNAALRVGTGGSSCCGAAPATSSCDPITSNLYDAAQSGEIPAEAMLASLGCANPTALVITQFEMTTSTELSGSGICSISPFRNSTLSTPAFFLFSFARASISSVNLSSDKDAVLREAFRVLKPGGRFPFPMS